MFDKNFNIILGKRSSGKTYLLWEISSLFKSLGYKICFIGLSSEFDEGYSNHDFIKHFDLHRNLVDITGNNDIKMLELVKEIVERDSYDYIFIDDMHLNERIHKLLSDIKVKKVCTSNIFYDEFLSNDLEYDYYGINNIYDDESMQSLSIIEYNGLLVGKVEEFLISLSRDLKINNLLNE